MSWDENAFTKRRETMLRACFSSDKEGVIGAPCRTPGRREISLVPHPSYHMKQRRLTIRKTSLTSLALSGSLASSSRAVKMVVHPNDVPISTTGLSPWTLSFKTSASSRPALCERVLALTKYESSAAEAAE